MTFPLTPPDEPTEKAHLSSPCPTCGNGAVHLRERNGRVRATCVCGRECCAFHGHLSDSRALDCWEEGTNEYKN